jgi:hypothetical protein
MSVNARDFEWDRCGSMKCSYSNKRARSWWQNSKCCIKFMHIFERKWYIKTDVPLIKPFTSEWSIWTRLFRTLPPPLVPELNIWTWHQYPKSKSRMRLTFIAFSINSKFLRTFIHKKRQEVETFVIIIRELNEVFKYKNVAPSGFM